MTELLTGDTVRHDLPLITQGLSFSASGKGSSGLWNPHQWGRMHTSKVVTVVY